MAEQSAVEWLINEINSRGPKENNPPSWLKKLYQKAEEIEKQQHGVTWDAAIKAHDNRGHVHARSIIDFDEWYEQQFKTK
jgi:hypothetical protein